MKTVLILVGEKDSANGICAESIIKEFNSNGYRIICLTTKKGEKFQEKKLEIYTIKPRLIDQIKLLSSKYPQKIGHLMMKIATIINKLNLAMSIFTWPLISPAYTLRMYSLAKKICKKNTIDCIICIYNPIDTVITGYLIKKKYPNVKFIPYFLDSLSGGHGPKIFSNQWTIKRGLKWEKKLLKKADKIIIMKSSEKHHKEYSKELSYYSKITVLDIPLLKEINMTNKINLLNPSKVNLVYVGSIPYHIRNPEYILEIFKRINLEDCEFTIIGTSTCPQLIKKAQKESCKNRILVYDSMEHEDVISIMQQADFLVNIGNNITNMVPSKIFEYMSIGKPIISTYPIKDEPSLIYLKNYPLAMMIEEDWSRIEENTKEVEKFIVKMRNKNQDIKTIIEDMYINTPKAFVDEIKKIL